jgi:hypothetical protein
MPAKPQWLLRIPEIIHQLRRLDLPVVDRMIVERLFGLRRRRAIDLLHSFGGYQTGRMFLIDRLRLIAQLEAVRGGSEFHYEERRKERLVETLDKLRKQSAAARVAIRVDRETMSSKMADLGDGIRLQPGRLTVDFRDGEDLLSKLFRLAQSVANDFEKFQRVTQVSE